MMTSDCLTNRNIYVDTVMQALAQVAELRQQQTLLRTHIQGEVALASSECTHQLEAAQYTWRQKALLMEGQAQSESLTVAKLQAHSNQVWVEGFTFRVFIHIIASCGKCSLVQACIC